MRISLIALFILAICSSSTTNYVDNGIYDAKAYLNRDIVLFNGLKFSLLENETESAIQEEDKVIYHSLVKDSPVQIPLFKKIKGSGYSIYIGLPVGLEFEKAESLRMVNFSFKWIEDSSIFTDEMTYRVYENDMDMRIVEQITMKNKSKFYTIYYSDSSVLDNENFSADKCLERIN